MDSPSPLDNLSIAAPCSANWAEMSGDDRARFCKLCTKHVYNLSAMSRPEAEALIIEKEGKLCIRFAQRADGTVISDHCPVGLRAARDRMRWIGAGIAAGLAFLATAMGSTARAGSLKSWLIEQPIRHSMGGCVMTLPLPSVGVPTPVNTPAQAAESL